MPLSTRFNGSAHFQTVGYVPSEPVVQLGRSRLTSLFSGQEIGWPEGRGNFPSLTSSRAFGQGREEDSPAHSRVHILARVNHHGSRKPVDDIQRQRVLGSVEPRTIKGVPSGYHP